MNVTDLPVVNASLNALSTVFLTAGYVLIKRGNQNAHRNCMVAAFVTSTVFLACYLTYHFSVTAVTKFTGEGWVRGLYFGILISHIFLAVVIVPLVLISLYRAWKQQYELHRRIARWTWPLWMYVSVTGVIVYLMLYQWYPAPKRPSEVPATATVSKPSR